LLNHPVYTNIVQFILCILFMIFLNDFPYLSRPYIFDYSKNSNNAVNVVATWIKGPIVRAVRFVCGCGRKIANFALELRFEKPIFALVLQIAFHYGSQSIKLRNGFRSRAHTHNSCVCNNIVSLGQRVLLSWSLTHSVSVSLYLHPFSISPFLFVCL